MKEQDVTVDTIDECIKKINAFRKRNQNEWIVSRCSIKPLNKTFQIKSYKTWVQIFQCEKFRDSSPMGLKVKEFNNYLLSTIEKV